MGCKGISQRGPEATSPWLSSLLCDIQSSVYCLCSLVILSEVDISNFAPFWNPHEILSNETYIDETVSTTDDNYQDPTFETPGTLQEMKKIL